MSRAKEPVLWFRKIWSVPLRVALRAVLYALVGTAGIGLTLPALTRGEGWPLVVWVAGPLLVLLFAGLNEIGALPPEQETHKRGIVLTLDQCLALGFGVLLLITVVSGVNDISKLESFDVFHLLPAVFAGLFAVIATGLLARPLWGTLSVELGVDEGGVRLRRRGASSYWPFDLLRDARVQVRGLSPRLVVRDRTGRAVVELPLLGKRALERGHALCDAIEAGITDAQAGEECPAELRRGERTMREWLDGSRRLLAAARAGNYRVRVSEEQVLATLENVAAPIDARAAAAYALLAARSPGVREEVRRRIGPASPPLVQLAVRLSDEGPSLIDDAALEGAIESLDEIDRAEALELLERNG